MASGLVIGSSSKLSVIVKSDIVEILIDGDGGTEDFGFLPEGISGAVNGRVGVWGSSPTPGSPKGVAGS